MNETRVARMLERARAQGLEAIVIMPGPNMVYLTGLEMHLSERPAMLFFPVHGQPFAFCPAFEAERITTGAGITQVFPWGEEEGPAPVLKKALTANGIGGGVLGVEYRYMRVLERELLARAIAEAPALLKDSERGLAYEDAGTILADLRAQKDQEELALLQMAASIADAGVGAAHEFIRPGVSERAVAAYMEQELQKLGAVPPFDIYVASGPRAAVPHAGATDRILQEGELVWVDFVCHHEGYVGDITRTFPVGKVTGRLAEIFQVCLEAQAKARAEARPGMTGAQVDAIARDYIKSKGYGEYFTHRTGHGIGLEVHEEPYIVGSNHRRLEAGSTFTIEPGIYIPGLGGVRIEDDVVLEPAGARSLTQYPRDLLGNP
ncbi:MAG TPA: Xaa-Pro peptidase family protein [Symbiobacteriaceae bacterium]|nr:Xaa-Pro peptidase family protein [Symbiobacteriaceae bacterium]